MLRLIALGHTNTEIGEQLYLSTRTVETPSPDDDLASRGVVATGPVGARWAGRGGDGGADTVWGRDELGLGEMWNSSSVIAWAPATAGLPAGELRPPPHGRAPGWAAGVTPCAGFHGSGLRSGRAAFEWSARMA